MSPNLIVSTNCLKYMQLNQLRLSQTIVKSKYCCKRNVGMIYFKVQFNTSAGLSGIKILYLYPYNAAIIAFTIILYKC